MLNLVATATFMLCGLGEWYPFTRGIREALNMDAVAVSERTRDFQVVRQIMKRNTEGMTIQELNSLQQMISGGKAFAEAISFEDFKALYSMCLKTRMFLLLKGEDPKYVDKVLRDETEFLYPLFKNRPAFYVLIALLNSVSTIKSKAGVHIPQLAGLDISEKEATSRSDRYEKNSDIIIMKRLVDKVFTDAIREKEAALNVEAESGSQAVEAAAAGQARKSTTNAVSMFEGRE